MQSELEQDQGPIIFRTHDLPLAAFLHATRELRFLDCQPVNDAFRVVFLFEDPNLDGDRLRVEFEGGAVCPAAAFYDSVRHLRRVTDGTRNNRNKGALEREQHIHWSFRPIHPTPQNNT